jgi:glycosyltransferase involved in cell wall biosynthesis
MVPVLGCWVERLGLGDHVRICDEWLPESTYRDYLLAADLAIQLRAPGFVGLSGSALDCLGAGLPTVMNDALAEALEAPGYVARVPDHFSPVLMAERLLELAESGRYQVRDCPERAEYVAAHTFERYADELLRVLKVA